MQLAPFLNEPIDVLQVEFRSILTNKLFTRIIPHNDSYLSRYRSIKGSL